MLLHHRVAALVLAALPLASLLAPATAQDGQPPAKAPAPTADEVAAAEDTIPRVVPVFDPGSHTQPICALGFSGDKTRLITVGQDASIQVWSTTTGERLDILRLPAYGHDQVSDLKAWSVAAVSPDGRYVAIGGGQRKSLSEENRTDRAKLLLVDVAQRTVSHVNSPPGELTAVAFAPDNRLAAAFSGAPAEVLLFPEIKRGDVRRRQSRLLSAPGALSAADFLQFSPDGRQLLASHGEREVVLWDLSPPQPQLQQRFAARGSTTAVAWSPDRRRFARARSPGVKGEHGFELRSSAGELLQDHLFAQLAGFDAKTDLRFLAFTGPDRLLLGSSDASGRNDPGAAAYRFDLTAAQGAKLFAEPAAGLFDTAGAVSHDGELAALTVSMGLDTVIYRVRDGAVTARCGAASPQPTVVGWSTKAGSLGFAWSETRKSLRLNSELEDLQYGFDLARLEPLAAAPPGDYALGRQALGDWSIRNTSLGKFEVYQGETARGAFQGGNGHLARTLVPQGDGPPLVAWAGNNVRERSSPVSLSRSDGSLRARLKPAAVFVRDIAASPDGRFVIVSTGAHLMRIYAVAGDSFPLLTFARVQGEWVAWTRAGYFAASPGGEKLFGWAVSNGPEQLSTFHPAEKFAAHFRRPDLLRLALQLGSLEAALKQQSVRAPAVEQLLPPRGELQLLQQTGARVQVRATAQPGGPQRPVVALRLLLDGRPLDAATHKTLAAGEPAEATWALDIPAGRHELKLLVRGTDNSAVSEPLVLTGPRAPSQLPVLHRLCVGVDQYALPALNLTSAAKDARDVYAALERHCVGPSNRFGQAAGALLLNEQATRAAVLKAIAETRKTAKPGDLLVVLFAGHGVQQPTSVTLPGGRVQNRDEYYLLTHESDPHQSLQGKSLSGADLQQALGPLGCPVLLVMDSCHSASGVKAFRPAIDDLTRGLTDDATGVTILAAAMSHEVATASAENGHFTAAFLKALAVGPGVPYDPHEQVLYTHHIYSVVFSEVRKATGGKQNPFLNAPWTVPPLALRDVPPQRGLGQQPK